MSRTAALSCLSALLAAFAAFPAAAQTDAAPEAEAVSPPAPRPPRIAVSVRMMASDEITRTYDIGRLPGEVGGLGEQRPGLRKLPGENAAGLFVGPPMLFFGVRETPSSTLMVGPPSTIDFTQARFDMVSRGLLESDFPGMVAAALRELAPAARYEGAPPEGISVSLAFYGLRTREAQPTVVQVEDSFCFVATGSAFALIPGGTGPERPFTLGVAERSSGMPEPRCASFLEYSERGAYRLRLAMQQAAENIARWLIWEVLGGR